MRTLCTLLVAVVLIGGMGIYFQWWKVSTTSGPDHTQIQVNVNKEKIREDFDHAKQRVGELRKEMSHDKTEVQPSSQQ
jgi:hypothetical protein